MKLFSALVVVALAVALSPLSACGGDDDSGRDPEAVERPTSDQRRSGSSGSPLSRRTFARKTERICDQLRLRVSNLSKKYLAAPAPTAEQISTFAGGAATELEKVLSRLRSLPAPRADKAEIASLIRAAEQGISRLAQAAQDPEAAKELVRAGDPFARTRTLARRSGLRACTISG